MITVTDMFCGAGGSTTGAAQAGAEVRLAMNHWPRAIETHNTNYPAIDHALADISQADPRYYPRTTMLVASPECTNHSLAKGKTRVDQQGQQATLWGSAKQPDPSDERSRCTMWDPLRFAECHDYQIVILENVVDARSWRMWNAWLHAWQCLDYDH
jgi:DNA (cytosine-5)-methyltransferase 1